MESISNNLPAIALTLAGLGLVAMIVMQSLQISNLRQRVDKLTGGSEDGNLEDVLIQHLESVHAVGRDLDELIARVAFLESTARHHYSRQGLVRFNLHASDTGGYQSFALALLDESNDGLIMSSLHSRTGTRIYTKAVVGGKTEAALSTEETQAIEEAMARRPSTSPSAKARAAAREPGRGAARSGGPAAKPAPATVATPATPVTAVLAPTVESDPSVPAFLATPPAEPDPAAPAVGEPLAALPAEPDAQDEPAQETTRRPAPAKGQSKSEALGAADAEPEAEKTGARPGRSGGPRP